MRCLIVAAGQGARLRDKGESKPLIRIKGRLLIERVIASARRAGIEEFYVVSGYRGEPLRAELDRLAARDAIRITHIVNADWERGNGVSVLKASGYLNEPFILTMCDHLVDPEIFRALIGHAAEDETVTLGVDFNINDPINDPEDVTRVHCAGSRVAFVGKVIRRFNAFDTGVFLCTPIIFSALEASQAAGDDSISGAMNILAGWGRSRAFDIGDRVWVDVDDPVAFDKAEHLIEAGRI